jgi:hypothetical protein
MLARQSPQTTVAEAADLPAAPAPDISAMSPRERFNRLYNRVMQAAQSGDEATVARFTPMAFMAYTQLDSTDADARYHMALLKAHAGDVAASAALGDTILMGSPGHLFGHMIRGMVARFGKDEKALGRAYQGFLENYEVEMSRGRAEYEEHRTSVADFRKASLEGRPSRSGGSR